MGAKEAVAAPAVSAGRGKKPKGNTKPFDRSAAYLGEPYKNKTPGRRTCSKCEQDLPLDAEHFYRSRQKGFKGFQYVCKKCHAEYNRSYIQNNRDKARAKHKAYRKKNPALFKASQLASYYKHDGLTYRRVRADMVAGLPCPYCAEVITPESLSYDHVDGAGSALQATCVACNRLKNVFSDEDFRRIVELIGPARLEHYRHRVLGQVESARKRRENIQRTSGNTRRGPVPKVRPW